jgi:DNA-binding CsgD family transcriptional regulator
MTARVGPPALPPTARQRQILAHVAAGVRDAEIARRLGLSPHTLRSHLRDCYIRLGVEGSRGARTLAALWWEGERARRAGSPGGGEGE